MRLLNLTMTSNRNLLLQTHLNHTVIVLNPTSMFLSIKILPYTGLLGTWLTLTINYYYYYLLTSQHLKHFSVDTAHQFCVFL